MSSRAPSEQDHPKRPAPPAARILEDRLEAHESAWVAPGAVVVGDVTLGRDVSVWYGCVLRGDLEPIRVGDQTNIQDLTLVHVDLGLAAEIGSRVTVGHRCIIHGCKIGDDVLIGMGAVVLSGAVIGEGSVVAAGAVVREGAEIPPGSFVAGVPAKVKGPATAEMRERTGIAARTYVRTVAAYRAGTLGRGPHGGAPGGEGERR